LLVVPIMAILPSRRTWSVVVPIAVFMGAFLDQQNSSLAQEPATGTIAVATITNQLPVDGCSYPVTIGGIDYAPDAASITAISDRVTAGGSLRVLIDYRLTGNTGQVECGFGTSRTLPEVSFEVRRVLDDNGQGVALQLTGQAAVVSSDFASAREALVARRAAIARR
jgi:hypothetical protein